MQRKQWRPDYPKASVKRQLNRSIGINYNFRNYLNNDWQIYALKAF